MAIGIFQKNQTFILRAADKTAFHKSEHFESKSSLTKNKGWMDTLT